MKRTTKNILCLVMTIIIASVLTFALVGCDDLGAPEIESIKIVSDESFKLSSHLILSSEVTPKGASDSGITYSIVNSSTTAKGAKIVDNVLRAESEGYVGVVAKAPNGVTSDIMIISVQKEPVTFIRITNDNRIRFKEFQQFDSASVLSETGWNATGNVEFLTNDNNALSGRGMVGLKAQNAGIYRTFSLNPHETLSIKFSTSNRSTDAYKSYYIVKILDGGTWRNYGDTLQCNVSDWKECIPVAYTNDSDININLTIGFFRTNGNSLFVNPTVFIDDMTITITTQNPLMRAGTQLALTTTILPFNATYQDVTYQIIEDGTTSYGAYIKNGVLYANKSGVVKIYAIADGVYSDPYTIEVI